MEQRNNKIYGDGLSSEDSELDSSFEDFKHETSKRKLNDNVSDVPKKKLKQFVIESDQVNPENAQYSNIAKNLMKKMGYIEGKGIGKDGHGIVKPIEASKQKGRRGLGLMTRKGLDGPANVGWDFEAEENELQSCEQLVWHENFGDLPENLEDWMEEGPLKLNIDDETTFCDAEILEGVLSNKSVFDEVDAEDMRKSRTRSNPFETIKSVFFQNRAAMKMANMDSVFEFMFTTPRKEFDDASSSLVDESFELFSFADVCAGPGGFSEYVLWKKKGFCRGFGFTLRGEQDFKLHDFNAGPPEMFQTHYGVKDDGDVYDDSNQVAFQEFVLKNTNNRGVHLMMADGGFSCDGQENIQEILSHRLYLCQFLVSLMVLREGGNFVCKLFDLFTPFSVGLVYLMSLCFERFAIFKPVTSRPANSERYIICQGKKNNCERIQNYFRFVNNRMSEVYPGRKNCKEMVLNLVPTEVLVDNESFFKYIEDSNNKLGDLQIMSLMKIKTFTQNKSLVDPKQTDYRSKYLQKWHIPDIQKKDLFAREHPSSRFNKLIQPSNLRFELKNLDNENLERFVKVKKDFRILPISSTERYFLLGMGKGSVHRTLVNRFTEGVWESCDQIELPRDTILDVEFVEEQKGEEGRSRKRVLTIHVNDVLVWFGNDLTGHSFESRRHLITLLLKGMSKEQRHDLLRYHVKPVYKLENIEEDFFGKIEFGFAKGKTFMKSRLLQISDEEKRFMVPIGICLIKVINEPWMSAWSKSQQKEYFFHTLNRSSVFEVPLEAVANYFQSFRNSYLWCWSETNSQEALLQFLSSLNQ